MSTTLSRPSTSLEKFILFIGLAILPFQDEFAVIKNVSAAWIFFVGLAVYVGFARTRELSKAFFHPIFVLLFMFVFMTLVIESLHPLQDYREINQIFQTVLGAVLIACICRDASVVSVALWAMVVTGVSLSIIVIATGYELLSQANAAMSGSARIAAFTTLTLKINLNIISFYISQGLFSAVMLYLNSSRKVRLILLPIIGLLVLGCFVPMSRGGLATALLCCLLVVYYSGALKLQSILPVAIIAIVTATVVATVVPDVIFDRTLSLDTKVGMVAIKDVRLTLYEMAWENLSDYLAVGVGSGNFWNQWGFENGFAVNDIEGKGVMGVHNAFLQVTIYWGLLGLSCLIFAILGVFFMLVRMPRNQTSTYLRVFGVSVFLLLLVVTTIYVKTLSYFLGMLVGLRLASNRDPKTLQPAVQEVTSHP